MELSQRDKYLIVVSVSEYIRKLKEAEQYFEGLGVKYRSKTFNAAIEELGELRERVGGEEWIRYLQEYLSS